jgi:hypothetical protein
MIIVSAMCIQNSVHLEQGIEGPPPCTWFVTRHERAWFGRNDHHQNHQHNRQLMGRREDPKKTRVARYAQVLGGMLNQAAEREAICETAVINSLLGLLFLRFQDLLL